MVVFDLQQPDFRGDWRCDRIIQRVHLEGWLGTYVGIDSFRTAPFTLAINKKMSFADINWTRAAFILFVVVVFSWWIVLMLLHLGWKGWRK